MQPSENSPSQPKYPQCYIAPLSRNSSPKAKITQYPKSVIIVFCFDDPRAPDGLRLLDLEPRVLPYCGKRSVHDEALAFPVVG